MSDRFKITWPVEKRERVWRRLRNCKNCINCPKRKYIKIKLNFPSFILALIHRVWQRPSITGDNKFQWSRFASVNKTNLRHMLLTKIARFKPQILKKQPLRHEVHCIVYAPHISFRFSRVPRGTRKKQTAWAALLNTVLWLVRYGPLRKQSHRGKDSQSESRFGMVLFNCYNGLYCGETSPERASGIWKSRNFTCWSVKWGRKICHFRR